MPVSAGFEEILLFKKDLKQAVDEIRECGQYLSGRNPDLMKGFNSGHNKAKRVQAEKVIPQASTRQIVYTRKFHRINFRVFCFQKPLLQDFTHFFRSEKGPAIHFRLDSQNIHRKACQNPGNPALQPNISPAAGKSARLHDEYLLVDSSDQIVMICTCISPLFVNNRFAPPDLLTAASEKKSIQ